MDPRPTITVIQRDSLGTRYRIEGGEIDARWAETLRRGHTPWCEFTVTGDGISLSSYGGEVWPTAWPRFFQAPTKRTIYNNGHIYLTDEGRALLAEAH